MDNIGHVYLSKTGNYVVVTTRSGHTGEHQTVSFTDKLDNATLFPYGYKTRNTLLLNMLDNCIQLDAQESRQLTIVKDKG